MLCCAHGYIQYTPAKHVSRRAAVGEYQQLPPQQAALCVYVPIVCIRSECASLSDISPGVSCTDISMLLLLLVRSVRSRATAMPAALLSSAGTTVRTREALSCIVLFALRHACFSRTAVSFAVAQCSIARCSATPTFDSNWPEHPQC